MNNNVAKILGYAAVVLIALILISLIAGFFAWIWSNLLIGFGVAFVFWIIQKYIRNKPTGDGFITYWGLGLTVLFVAIDLLKMFFVRYSWLIFVALIVGFLWWLWNRSKSKK